MLAADAPPLMTVPSSPSPSSPTSVSSPPVPPSAIGSDVADTALTVASKGTLTWMRQLALVIVYYLVFKAAATNPIAANLREHLRVKLLAPGKRGVTEAVRGFFRR